MCSGDRAKTKNERSKKGIRPVERQKMRPWLTELLDSGSVQGLSWENKQDGVFRINWKHGSRHGWSSSRDASLFQRYAEHTGRFDAENPSPKKWKANFRCALNSLKDVSELSEKCVSKGHQAHKVYKFLDEGETKPKKANSSEKSKSANAKKRQRQGSQDNKKEDVDDVIPSKVTRCESEDSLSTEISPQKQPTFPDKDFDGALLTFAYPKHLCGCKVIKRDLNRTSSVPVQSLDAIPRPVRPLSHNDSMAELCLEKDCGKIWSSAMTQSDKSDHLASNSSLTSHSASSGDEEDDSEVSSSSDSCESRSSSPWEQNEFYQSEDYQILGGISSSSADLLNLNIAEIGIAREEVVTTCEPNSK